MTGSVFWALGGSMYAIIYIFSAFTLLRYVFSTSYRAKTNARWKKTPKRRVVGEIGAGIFGLIILAGILYLILSSADWNVRS
jgi:hypothetical protein